MSSVFDSKLALESNAWPFQEAQALLDRVQKAGSREQKKETLHPAPRTLTPEKDYVLFETGYGPSGLPHIGTFGEVARTTMVRHAFECISGMKTKLFAFSDDMDGLRKVPDNIPQQEMVAQHIGKPLTSIPDPFGTHESYGAHMNGRLRAFLDQYGFDYEFKSSTECYKSGMFDAALLTMLREYERVQKVMLPTLGEERRASYSPFMPLCPETGKVLAAPVLEVNAQAGTIVYENEAGKKVETKVTGGACKLQWKPDWGMRWAALGVDYEMHGKDLTPSAVLSSQICKIIGGTPPLNYVYEMFLDEKGEKISKSKGNGISMEEWLRYGTKESLSLFMYANPRKAKRLYFDVIPKSVDEHISFVEKSAEQTGKELYANPAWHIHKGAPEELEVPLTYALLLNLAAACNAHDENVMWGFISEYAPGTTPQNAPHVATLVELALHYYEDFIKPNKNYRAPTDKERAAMQDLAVRLESMPQTTSQDEIQTLVFSVGKDHGFENLREWFQALYEVLLGQSQGPRMGSFIKLYGIAPTRTLIARALQGEDLAA